MNEQHIADKLNEVLVAVEGSPHARWAETGTFSSSSDPEIQDALAQIRDDDVRCAAQLAEAISALGGLPTPGTPDIETARFHFMDLRFMLSEMIRSKEQLASICLSGLESLEEGKPGSQVVARVATCQRDHVALLRGIVRRGGASGSHPS